MIITSFAKYDKYEEKAHEKKFSKNYKPLSLHEIETLLLSQEENHLAAILQSIVFKNDKEYEKEVNKLLIDGIMLIDDDEYELLTKQKKEEIKAKKEEEKENNINTVKISPERMRKIIDKASNIEFELSEFPSIGEIDGLNIKAETTIAYLTWLLKQEINPEDKYEIDCKEHIKILLKESLGGK